MTPIMGTPHLGRQLEDPLRTSPHLTAGDQSPPSPVMDAPIDSLVRGVAAHALDCLGAHDCARELVTLGPLETSAHQLAAVQTMGRGILAADVAAVQATEQALTGRENSERVQIIATLGARSSRSAQETESCLAPLVARATRQGHVAPALVEDTRTTVGGRHSDRNFVYWVSEDPDGFCRFAWSASLEAAGARVWDRNWQRLIAQAEATMWHRPPTSHTDPERVEALESATTLAREAAIRSLVESALSDDPSIRRRAWLNALEAAERSPGTVAWVRYTQSMRDRLPPTTWTTTNSLIGDHVSVIVNDLPGIAGFVGMIALAAEATIAAARTGAVLTGAKAMAEFDDFDAALAAARIRSTDTLAWTA